LMPKFWKDKAWLHTVVGHNEGIVETPNFQGIRK
jgi:hypothetical protein